MNVVYSALRLSRELFLVAYLVHVAGDSARSKEKTPPLTAGLFLQVQREDGFSTALIKGDIRV